MIREVVLNCNLDGEWCDYCSVESICCVELLCDICLDGIDE